MKTKLCLLMMVFAVVQIVNGQNTWVQKANYGGSGRSGAVGFSIGNKGYIGEGDDNINIFSDFWEFDPLNNIWTQIADLPGVPRDYAVGFSIGSKGYVGTGLTGGSGNTNLNDFWEYDPLLNSWTQKANFGGIARFGAVGFSIGNKGYIGTGSFHKDFWEYDPITDSWVRKANLPGIPRRWAAGFSIDSKGYIGTGQYIDSNINRAYLNDFYEYNATTNKWTAIASYPVSDGLCYSVCFSIGNKGYLGMGWNDHWLFNSFREYDPAANTWKRLANSPGIAGSPVGISINNKGYVGLVVSNDFWEYTPCVYPSAVITTGGATTFCNGGSVTLSAPAQANPTYQWKKGGIDIPGATSVSYNATATGNYKVTVTNTTSGCSKTTITPKVVTVNPNSSAAVTPQGPTTFCAGGSVVLQTNTATGLAYKWKKGINYISGATASSYTATLAGTYRAEVTRNNNGCSTTSAGVVVTVPCKEGEEAVRENTFNISVYPNPSAGDFTVAFGNSIETGSVEVYSSLNEKVFEAPIQNESKKEIHLKNNSKGIYFVSVRAGKDRVGRKMVELGISH